MGGERAEVVLALTNDARQPTPDALRRLCERGEDGNGNGPRSRVRWSWKSSSLAVIEAKVAANRPSRAVHALSGRRGRGVMTKKRCAQCGGKLPLGVRVK